LDLEKKFGGLEVGFGGWLQGPEGDHAGFLVGLGGMVSFVFLELA
jgi:hypothetical protein